MVLAALIEGGECNVKDIPLLHALNRMFGMDTNAACEALREAKQQFDVTGLVKLSLNPFEGDELSINPTWRFQLRRQVAKWRAGRRGRLDVV